MRAKDVYETFKAKFSPGSGTSSSTGFALVDMQASMFDASSNAPRFIAAFLAGCEALARSGTDVPDLDLVNERLAEHSAGYQIIGDTLVATSESLKDLDAAVEERSVVVDVPPGALRVEGKRSDAKAVSSQELRVFLCHSTADKHVVRQLHGRLKADGFKPWLEEDLVGGQDWDAEIRKAVRRSHVGVVCLSRSSVNKSGYVQKEIRAALDFAEARGNHLHHPRATRGVRHSGAAQAHPLRRSVQSERLQQAPEGVGDEARDPALYGA